MNFRERIASGVLIGDGGWGALLGERGLPPGAAPERWTLEHPELIAEIARAYVDAGAQLVTTNTFGGSRMRLRQHRLEDRFDEINRRAIEIVREAIGTRAFVNASIGPTGRLLAPLGDAEPEDVARAFAEQARVLVDAGADVICIETMTDLGEAELAVRAVRSISASIPIIASMTFDITPRGPFTVMGVSVVQAAAALTAAGATLVGANCGAGVEEMRIVAEAFVACATVPVAIQPNAGLPERRDGELFYRETPELFAAGVAAIAALGARVVGGCCGTTPAHIGELRKRIETLTTP
jgi:5-methyltetrahydrofolate--homocysteine methyltransferase